MSPKKAVSLEISVLVKAAIRDAVKKALKAEPKQLNLGSSKDTVFEMDRQLWTLESAIEYILGEYSWMRDN